MDLDEGRAATRSGHSSCRFPPRDPELVSGSIGESPFTSGLRGSLRHRAGHVAQWTLKRVQGDDFGISTVNVFAASRSLNPALHDEHGAGHLETADGPCAIRRFSAS